MATKDVAPVPTEHMPRKVTRHDWLDPPTPEIPALPVPLLNAATSIVEKKLLFVGGYSPSLGKVVNSTAEFDINTRMWSALGVPQFPVPVSECSMVSIGNVHYVFGGTDGEKLSGDLWSITTQSNGDTRGTSWALLSRATSSNAEDATNGPSPRRSSSAAAGVLRGRAVLFVFGGFDGRRRKNDLWAFDVDSKAWEELYISGNLAPSPRDGATLVYNHVHTQLLLIGGFASSPLADMYSLSTIGSTDTDSFEWSIYRSENPPPPRFGSFGIIAGHYLVVGLGHDARGASGALYQMNLVDRSWTLCPTDGDDLDTRQDAAYAPSPDLKRITVIGGSTVDGRHLTSMVDIEFEKSELPTKSKK